ncbi:hypothetical protein RHSIM_Rhsim06G0199900 [Rhododendron simsii]|uniref:Uncharacterized protein n=1 Tax=Rhododendron simsii TaxID=118357 RepID=A0A834GW70_RHOSS|nr:hypothetical protein RHSIM_Rhsim06G0199900 [Rhododendron simsii]
MPRSSTSSTSEARLQPDRSPTVVDLEEAKNQFLYLLPVIITNASYYLIPIVAFVFVGHLGGLELVGWILAVSWASVTSFAFMVLLYPISILSFSFSELLITLPDHYLIHKFCGGQKCGVARGCGWQNFEVFSTWEHSIALARLSPSFSGSNTNSMLGPSAFCCLYYAQDGLEWEFTEGANP